MTQAPLREDESSPDGSAGGGYPGLHWILRGLLLGVLPGVLIYLALFGVSLLGAKGAEYMGVDASKLATTLIDMFKDDLVTQQLGLMAIYAKVGALVGAFAFIWMALLNSYRRKDPSWGWTLASTVGLTLLIHALFMMRSMGTYPQIYELAAKDSFILEPLFYLGVDVLPVWVPEGLGALLAGSGLILMGALVWRHNPAIRNLKVVSAAGAAVAISIALLLSGPSAPEALQKESRPNVLLVAVDSLRGDVVANNASITPHLNKLASETAHFTQAYTVVARTFPSWVSILTGQYPHTHGIRHMFPAPTKEGLAVPSSIVWAFAKAGYRTGVITDAAGEIFSRVDLGFEHTDAPEFTLKSNVELGGVKRHIHLMPYIVDVDKGEQVPQLNAMERLGDPFWLTARATDWITAGDPRPFFLTLFYSAGHFPFASPAPFYRRFVDPEYRGRSRFAKATFGKPLEGAAGRAEHKQIRGLYAGAVAASDAAIGELLETLEALGLLKNTIVVITADHGENLYEHGLGVGHGDHLYGPAGHHVPLIMKWPGLAGGEKITRRVRTVDIASSLLQLAGITAPTKRDGTSLVKDAKPAVTSDRPIYAETGLWFFPPETKRLDGKRIQLFDGFSAFGFQPKTTKIYLDPSYNESVVMAKHRMLVQDDFKLLYIPTRDGVRWELYDAARDPWDLKDLSKDKKHAATLAKLKKALYGWLLSDKKMIRVGEFVLPRRALGRKADGAPPTAAPAEGGAQ